MDEGTDDDCDSDDDDDDDDDDDEAGWVAEVVCRYLGADPHMLMLMAPLAGIAAGSCKICNEEADDDW